MNQRIILIGKGLSCAHFSEILDLLESLQTAFFKISKDNTRFELSYHQVRFFLRETNKHIDWALNNMVPCYNLQFMYIWIKGISVTRIWSRFVVLKPQCELMKSIDLPWCVDPQEFTPLEVQIIGWNQLQYEIYYNSCTFEYL